DFNMQIPANALTVILIMAFVTTHLRFATSQFWSSPGAPGKMVLTILLSVGICFLGWEGVRRGRENYWLIRGERTNVLSERAAALEKAALIEPGNDQTFFTLGEAFRRVSLEGNPGYEKQAEEAMRWYRRAMDLNPHVPYSFLDYGVCLDWLGRTREGAE